jgi:hypothetical protein
VKRLVLFVMLAVTLVAVAGAGGASFEEIDISHMRGSQAEVAIVADPAHPNVLLAASNSIDFHSLAALGNLMRVYTSTDSGATWASAPGPAATPYGAHKRCNSGDPAPVIDASGREYLAFLASQCITLDSILAGDADEFDIARLEVATRVDATSPWQVNQVYPVRSARFDDKPAIAVDTNPTSPHFGRLYVAWTRITPGAKHGSPSLLIAVSHSDDHGVTWTKPVIVADSHKIQTTFAGVAVDAAGTVFVSWSDVDRKLLLDRSTDGGDHFGTDVEAVPESLPVLFCGQPGSFQLPAQTKRCLTSTPMLTVDSRPGVPEHVYLTYSTSDESSNAQDVYVAVFDQNLAPIGPAHPVHPPDSRRDEFMSASALDDQGRLWVCYYDTGLDRTRKSTRYTCTASADGGTTFATPRAVASVASNETKSTALPFQYGDYEGLTVAGGVAHPIWTDGRDLASAGEEIYTSTLTPADLQLP